MIVLPVTWDIKNTSHNRLPWTGNRRQPAMIEPTRLKPVSAHSRTGLRIAGALTMWGILAVLALPALGASEPSGRQAGAWASNAGAYSPRYSRPAAASSMIVATAGERRGIYRLRIRENPETAQVA